MQDHTSEKSRNADVLVFVCLPRRENWPVFASVLVCVLVTRALRHPPLAGASRPKPPLS